MPQEEWEFEARDTFITFLREKEGVATRPGRTEVIVDPISRRNFDFELLDDSGNPFIALEVVRLTDDAASLKAHKGWRQICPAIKEELKALGYKSLSVLVPRLSFKQAQIMQFAKEQADLVHHLIQNTVHDKEGIRSHGYVIQTNRDYAGVYVSGVIEGGFFDGPGTAIAQLKPRLEKKNSQLDVAGYLRYLLVINQNVFVDTESFISGVRQLPLHDYGNIDRVYLQEWDGTATIAFDREVYRALTTHEFLPLEQRELYVFLLEQLLNIGDDLAFRRLQIHHERLDELGFIDDELRRAALLCADQALKKGESWQAIWAISMYQKTPTGSDEAEMNRRLISGEDIIFIQGVHAQIQWLVYELLFHNCDQYMALFVDTVEQALKDDNFYIRTQAAIALSGLAQISLTRTEIGMRFELAMRRRIRSLILTTLHANREHVPVLNSLTRVLRWLSNLSEEEATRVQQITNAVSSEHAIQDVVAFAFSLALGRNGASFNREPFRARLIEMLTVAGDRQRVGVWILAQSLENGQCSVEEVRFLIDPIVRSPQNSDSTFFFYELVKEVIKNDFAFGRECLEAVLESKHAQPGDGYDRASYQLAETLRQVAAKDMTAACSIASYIKKKFQATPPNGLLFLQPYLNV